MAQIDFTNLRVLLIDDHEFVINHTRRILNKLGITRIQTACNGQDALDLLDHGVAAPHLILSDISMPDMDGVALLRHLGVRASENGLQAAIIFVSGVEKRILQTAENLGKSHKLNVLGSIEKPIRSETFLALLQTWEPDRINLQQAVSKPLSPEELLEGIGGDKVLLYFQPKISIPDARFVGVEALARWQHPERGLIGPETFIPLAEQLGQIDKLTQNVIRKALAQCALWQQQGHAIKVAVNYSVDSLANLIQPEYIVTQAQKFGVNLDMLTIEMTESLVMHDLSSIIEVMTRMRLQGVGLSLDDFGTGHATMERLQKIPFTELKLDKSYVTPACHDTMARTILESAIALGKGLGMKLVAEGVEDQQCLELMKTLGCDEVQGFLIARPMPGDAIIPWLESWQARGEFGV